MVMNVVIVAAICRSRRARRCRSSPGYGAQPAADSRTDAGATPAARDRADDSPGAGADQTPSESALTRIIGVCMGRCRRQQSGADQVRDSRSLSHWLPLGSCFAKANRTARVAVPLQSAPVEGRRLLCDADINEAGAMEVRG
jgi:hypothetical protein